MGIPEFCRFALPLLAGVLVGCSHPEFAYGGLPATELKAYRSFALNPRKDFLFLVKGMHPVAGEAVKARVIRALEGKGFQWLPTDQVGQADLLLEVFTLAPGGEGVGPVSGSAADGFRGMRGERSGGHQPASPGRATPSHQGEGAYAKRGEFVFGGALTVVVQLVEAQSGRLQWFGSMTFEPTEKSAAQDSLGSQLQRLLAPIPLKPVSAPAG